MGCKTDNFVFDPEKTALENLFALIYRTNRQLLRANEVDVSNLRVIEEDEHGDNTIIYVEGKPGSRIAGGKDLYYARADIDNHYPIFEVDIQDLLELNDKDALIHYLDNRFNLVDGEFDLDLEDPFGSVMAMTGIDIYAKDTSLIYIGRKTINLFWSGGIRRITDDGQIRVTDEGQVRIIGLIDDL